MNSWEEESKGKRNRRLRKKYNYEEKRGRKTIKLNYKEWR